MLSLIKKIARLTPTYGNWGGPFYSGGRFTVEPDHIDYTVEPIDSLDECYRDHDLNYVILKDEFKSDWQLVIDLAKLEFPMSKWHRPPSKNTYALLYWFFSFWVFFGRSALKKVGILKRYKG